MIKLLDKDFQDQSGNKYTEGTYKFSSICFRYTDRIGFHLQYWQDAYYIINVNIPPGSKVSEYPNTRLDGFYDSNTVVLSNIHKLTDDPMWYNVEFCNKFLQARQGNFSFFRYIKYQTDAMCLEAVKYDGDNLYYVKNKTDEINLEAVKRTPAAIRFVDNQTDELCRLAVDKYGYTIRYVKNQTPELCYLACQYYFDGFRGIKVQTDELCKYAVKVNPLNIQHVKNQTDELCKFAVKKNPYAFSYIRNTHPEVIKVLLEWKGRYYKSYEYDPDGGDGELMDEEKINHILKFKSDPI